MLRVFERYDEIDFRQLMDVYSQWNQENGANLYPKMERNVQKLYSEQDFYGFLQSFFKVRGAMYFVWIAEGRYVAALRVEPYQDGFLLEGLETLPEERRKGYASCLVCAAIKYLHGRSCDRIYSHVRKDNLPSFELHDKCGFHIYKDDAVYIDGTYCTDSYTLIYSK